MVHSHELVELAEWFKAGKRSEQYSWPYSGTQELQREYVRRLNAEEVKCTPSHS